MEALLELIITIHRPIPAVLDTSTSKLCDDIVQSISGEEAFSAELTQTRDDRRLGIRLFVKAEALEKW